MDNLSYRNNRPTPRSNSEPEQPEAKPVPSSRPAASTRQSFEPAKRSGRFFKYVVALLLVVIIAAGAWYFLSRTSSVSSAIDNSKYQAVFFTNGQVYFGKLSVVNDEYMRLTNVYYLQTKSETDDKETSPQSAKKQNSSDVELIKLGGEIHGPEDAMIVSKDQMLFFENLKHSGNVSETITNYQNQNKSD